MILTLSRIIRFGFQSFFRNFWLSVATVSVLVLTLVSVNSLIIVNMLGNAAMTTVRSKIDVSVHFRPEVEESRVQTVKIALLSMPEVKDVEYISPARALETFSREFEDDLEILAALGEVGANPFGATLAVKAHDLEDYPVILRSLDNDSFKSLIEDKDFDDREKMIARVESIGSRIKVSGIALSLLFGLITLLIVLNTIRMSIYTHREELAIMRLVGASDSFIRGPYYVEAILWSVCAVATVFALLIPGLYVAQPFLQSFFGTELVDLVGFYNVNALKLAGAQFLGIVGLSLVTTKVATARYLRV